VPGDREPLSYHLPLGVRLDADVVSCLLGLSWDIAGLTLNVNALSFSS